MSKFAPTAEQQAVIDLFKTGADIVVEAGAGTGKTSTLVLLAEEADTRDLVGVYLAYNKAIAKEAAERFPRNVTCKTAHAFAFAALGRNYAKRLGTSTFVKSADLARFLGVDHDIVVGDRSLNKFAQCRLAQDMVAKFCKSADTVLAKRHLPYIEWLTDRELRRDLAEHILPFAEKAWQDLKLTSGTVRFTHDHYLKLWQLHTTYDNVVAGVLQTPVLDADFVLFDEAQDANPVIDAIVQAQTCQKVMVGDRAQAIYGWNGAIDAMSKFEGQRLQITQSFRYGQGIADCGNAFLAMLNSDLRLTGLGPVSIVGDLASTADAVLCRTNAGALEEALTLQAAGRKVHLVGGANDLRKFAEGARDLQTKRWTSHAVLSIFKSWFEVQDFAKNDPDGTDLQGMVNLIDKYSAATVLAVLDSSVTEDEADVILSTAHKAKGREWGSVRIAGDFADKTRKNEAGESEPVPLTDEDIMLRYVAVTRAKVALDPGPLTKYTAAQPVAA